MGILDWLLGGSSPGKRTVGEKRGNFLKAPEGYEVRELMTKDALEFGLRKAAFYACVNIIANYIGNAEMRFFQAGKEKKGNEWYRWNYEPNRNQNASGHFGVFPRGCARANLNLGKNEAKQAEVGGRSGEDPGEVGSPLERALQCRRQTDKKTDKEVTAWRRR